MSPLIGLSGIIFAIYYVFTHHSTGFEGYLDKASIVLVGVAPPSVMLLSHTLADFGTGIATLFKALFNTHRRTQKDVINTLTGSSALVRSEGIGALVKVRDRVSYELLRDGISLIINDFTPEEIRHNLSAKINAKQSRMMLASNLFENMSKVSPGCGMVGTLIGLIGMMSNLNDPDRIGSGMAVALITTLYGLILGTFLYAPSGEKISLEAEKALELDTMVLEGVLLLKGKKSSVHLKDIMKTYGRGAQPAGGTPSGKKGA